MSSDFLELVVGGLEALQQCSHHFVGAILVPSLAQGRCGLIFLVLGLALLGGDRFLQVDLEPFEVFWIKT